MKPRRKRGITSKQADEMWTRWGKGETISQISRAIDRAPGSVFGYLEKEGGIRPRRPKRADSHLTLNEREEISRGCASGLSLRAISRGLDRDASVVCREVKRNGGRRRYRAIRADERAWNNAKRPKKCLLEVHQVLREVVATKLKQDWSPEQISGWLRLAYPRKRTMRVSHETIYRAVYQRKHNVFGQRLCKQLRRKRHFRHSRTHKTQTGVVRGAIKEAVSIHDRPADIETRKSLGHWEGDLVCGSKHSQVATLVDRSSRYLMLVKIPWRDSITVVNSCASEVLANVDIPFTTLTWDRGMEFAKHSIFSERTGASVYFADYQSPWQRGTNENTNGLLRQYLPKKTDLSGYSRSELQLLADRLNTRPRKVLGFRTPAEVLARGVASTP